MPGCFLAGSWVLPQEKPVPMISLDVVNGGERQQGNLPRSFHGKRQHPLMLGTVAGNPSRNDLAPFRNKITQSFRIFVIYLEFTVDTETADLATMECASFIPDGHDSFPF
jgi:hypothetical protein